MAEIKIDQLELNSSSEEVLTTPEDNNTSSAAFNAFKTLRGGLTCCKWKPC
jgi:hypothetical protein